MSLSATTRSDLSENRSEPSYVSRGMNRRFALAVPVAVAGFAFAGLSLGAGADGLTLNARLAPGQETSAPKAAAHASGLFVASLSGRTLSWRLVFSRLTGKALAAHVHLGKPGVSGPVAVPLCGPCLSGAHGRVTVTARVRTALLTGGAYVNVHTAKNPGGEIRGQVGRRGVMQPGHTVTAEQTTTSSGGYGGGY